MAKKIKQPTRREREAELDKLIQEKGDAGDLYTIERDGVEYKVTASGELVPITGKQAQAALKPKRAKGKRA